MAKQRTGYPSDVSDEEWAFCAPYLRLMKEDAPQRKYPLRDLFNALRWLVRAGCPWRMMPNDLPPWTAVQQQTQRWLQAGCFEAMAHDLRLLLRLAAQRAGRPSAVILDSRTLQSTPESGARAGSHARGMSANLVVRRTEEAFELDFGNRPQPSHCQADCRADDAQAR